MTVAGEETAVPPDPVIDVVICTYNRAPGLDRMLENLSRQSSDDRVQWRVLVVDNASTDNTAEVVTRHRRKARLPDLRYVFEAAPGLTAARLRGARETTAPWIAFVDDDNFLEPTWLAAIGRAIRSNGGAGGIGGKVILDWEAAPPRYLTEFGFCFAAQDHGDADCIVDGLAGAGMVLNRRALLDCGWLDEPLVADRVGAKLTSGGDVEMAQRVRSAGYDLWYVADAVLRHHIPRRRMTRRYLFRIVRELGTSSAVIGLLTWPDDWQSWRLMARDRRHHWYGLAKRGLKHAIGCRSGFTSAIAWACFAFGFARGVRLCERIAGPRRAKLLGAAALPYRDDRRPRLSA